MAENDQFLAAGSSAAGTVLLEVANRDLWQSPLISCDGYQCGRVVRQLVEPRMCTIRYLIVYDAGSDRHIPVPAALVDDITAEAVFCRAKASALQALPSLAHRCLQRKVEEQIHQILAAVPYWIEESPPLAGPPHQ